MLTYKLVHHIGDCDDYYFNLEREVKDLKKDKKNENIVLTEPQEIKVNNRTFYTTTLSYSYILPNSHVNTQYTYYYTEIDDKNTYEIIVTDNDNSLTQNEIEKLMDITISDNTSNKKKY